MTRRRRPIVRTLIGAGDGVHVLGERQQPDELAPYESPHILANYVHVIQTVEKAAFMYNLIFAHILISLKVKQKKMNKKYVLHGTRRFVNAKI